MSTLRKFDDTHVWRKSSHSGGNAGTCLFATATNNRIGVRDSKEGDNGPQLWLDKREWSSLLNLLSHR